LGKEYLNLPGSEFAPRTILCPNSNIVFSLVLEKKKTGQILLLSISTLVVHEMLKCPICRSGEDGFSRALVMELLDQLETEPLPHLTPNEHAHLLVLIQTTLEVRQFRICFAIPF
jgi:hypothetical protein